MITKMCGICSSVKSVELFSRATASRGGRQPACKECANARNIEYRVNNPEKEAARKAAYRAANAAKVKRAELAHRAAHTQERAAYARAYNVGYSPKYRAENKNKIKLRGAAWVVANPAKVNATTARYRAAKLQATPGWASKEKIEEFYHTSSMLGMHTGAPYHVDHTVPLRSQLVCGLHTEANLQVLPGGENCSKANRYWPDMPGTTHSTQPCAN